MIQPSVFLVL